jgi:hypothetical protein
MECRIFDDYEGLSDAAAELILANRGTETGSGPYVLPPVIRPLELTGHWL